MARTVADLVAVAHPNRQVVCIVGDGGFTMLMGEVAMLVKYNLPVSPPYNFFRLNGDMKLNRNRQIFV